MSSGSSLTSKLYDKIIKMLSKSHETIPLNYQYLVLTIRLSVHVSLWEKSRDFSGSRFAEKNADPEKIRYSIPVSNSWAPSNVLGLCV
jgi:hypothetical protein